MKHSSREATVREQFSLFIQTLSNPILNMKQLEHLLAERLLKVSAIKLQPDNPFTWASGWQSPIYTDNRRTLSYPAVRTFIKTELTRIILENYEMPDVIAGVATGAIAQGAMVADLLGLPYIYVRSTPKDHGLENLIEGSLSHGQKVMVIEDLISTGQSSLKAAEAIRMAGGEVIGMVAMFTYGFPIAEERFKEAGIRLTTISNYEALLEVALETGFIGKNDVATLQQWRKDPSNWAPHRDTTID